MRPWQDSRPLPPDPCTSDRCWPRSAAISTRARNGARWLVRIEDLDTPRVVPGCADEMLRTLEAFGFEWDGEVLFQSTRRAAYARGARDACRRRAHLSLQLFAQGSRRHCDEESHGYPGTCRSGPTRSRTDRAALPRERCAYPLRRSVSQGAQHFDLATCGDVVVRAPRRPRELPARGGGRRCLPGSDARGARRRPAREHAVADRSAGRRWRCRSLSTDTCRCCWNRTAPNYRNPADRVPLDLSAAPRPSLRPLRICRRPHPPNWPTPLLKMCGNGQLRTGTHKRLRAKPRSGCPRRATVSRIER